MPVNDLNNKLNTIAKDFNLIGVDKKNYNLNSLVGKKGTVIAFICNHCPYVIKIIERFVYESIELKKIGVSTVAIMSNDTVTYPEDSFHNMKLFAKKYNFNFPYLFDSTQEVARNYNAVCTPDIFGFNKDKILKYRGRIDSGVMNNGNKNIQRDLFHAMHLITKINEGTLKQYNSFGCSIKWIHNE